MKFECFGIVGLVLIIVVLLILMRNRKRQFEKKVEQQRNQYEQQLSEQIDEAEEYRNEMNNNFRKAIPYGERRLIKIFQSLFSDSTFAGFSIYGHLEFESRHGFKQVDFFVVSPKGFFVIESKRWKGTTYIYSSSCPDLFQNTEHHSFGVGSSDNIRVFNAKKSEDNDDRIEISTYRNPVAQVREYSQCLREILKVTPIKNIVVFDVGERYAVLYDGNLLHHETIKYTSLVTIESLKDFFVNLRPDTAIDQQYIINCIEDNNGNFVYGFKMDDSNYLQTPYGII